ncbi:hypothetical protein ACFW1A_09390 [Kitasatospora sp. NPDC058965]|uniref:hypothetical protein n=1 Tax=Kitasatospora sp. NPDC058965 TaxID=3346682 RepID=UPI00369CAABA
MNIRKALSAVVVAGTALAGMTVAPLAHADGDCGAAWHDVGSPANLRINSKQTYVGQVEQQYQSCGGGITNVRAHFQWAGSFQQNYSGWVVHVSVFSPYYQRAGDQWYSEATKDAYSSPGIEIHHASPDAWTADATLTPCPLSGAVSTYWYYGAGTSWAAPNDGWC